MRSYLLFATWKKGLFVESVGPIIFLVGSAWPWSCLRTLTKISVVAVLLELILRSMDL